MQGLLLRYVLQRVDQRWLELAMVTTALIDVRLCRKKTGKQFQVRLGFVLS